MLKQHVFLNAATLMADAADWLQRHPKRITAAVAAVLLSVGGGAYAVANLTPDVDALPVNQITEAVSLPFATPLTLQADALDVHSLSLYRTDTSRSTDSVEGMLKRLGIVDAAAAAWLRKDPLTRQHLLGMQGRSLQAESNDNQDLRQLTVRWVASDGDTHFQRLTIKRVDGKDTKDAGHSAPTFVSHLDSSPLVPSTQLVGGVVQSTLNASAIAHQLSPRVTQQLKDIFADQADLQQDMKKGDRYSMVVESLQADGEVMATGRILSAEVTTGGKVQQAFWFEAAGQKGAYFNAQGQSLTKAFLTDLVPGARFSSDYGIRRHPVTGQIKEHWGHDYAAPTGTPIMAAGDGVVTFAGVQSGFGNFVIIQHRHERETAYAHMSQIGVQVGQAVTRGDVIGRVGRTGLASGPHLHFEYRVAGVHQNPSDLADVIDGTPVIAAQRTQFGKLANQMREQLAQAPLLQGTRVQ